MNDTESILIERALEGDREALDELLQPHREYVFSTLLARGANPTEANDVLDEVFASCVPGLDGRPSKLEKFSGRCALRSWLATVALRLWIDGKRRQQRQVTPAVGEEGQTDFFGRVPAEARSERDDELARLLRNSLEAAFAACEFDALLMLRLVYLHGLSQREVGRMWGYHESKVSRRLKEAMGQIESNTIRTIKEKDPWLRLAWDDFVELCQSEQASFL